mmetsp:Transcript_31198/g.43236  ORF Transcript_31198/g.43236 Transcript_31198/m.43236 type:complete len:134 (+) Transcript_31198:131-532(+)|eukprot:CAMPEP_0196591632 /NCGR_PEP_ID=MMETSP1081-20130531/70361_1 /TAXON_ID=36882 /ORGANISM="Pyramimonas amylifera, Strain CCMP720" /LENGTH=133 /DNA_ID=CAMNT_0041915051 /DNA_START=131 /DNA_END=532 /DNA_ORIENTATION=+
MEKPVDRMERLKALRAAAELSTQEDSDQQKEEETEVPVKFRNYLPKDEDLQKVKVDAAKANEFEEIVLTPAAGLDEAVDGEDAIANLAPKKANWDLKRDASKKLEKLERRTQRAMIELMQENQAPNEDGGGED